MEKYILVGLFGLFMLITLYEIFFIGYHIHKPTLGTDSVINFKKHIPETHFSNVMTGPRLRFSYCHSSGYKRIFDDYSRIVSEHFPEITVFGENHNPDPKRMAFAQMVTITKFFLIALIISNINPFSFLGFATPTVWNIICAHRLYGVMMIFFLCNHIEDRLLRTGAFEITYNGILVWSKLKTGRILMPPELYQLINNQKMMKGEVGSYATFS
ncbi:thioredoxin reductase-like selenoprotein T [Brevipalpus obovatus]|uniref:thioredoxin reductase-like selenoprotein T n=1 Tax=Brevipalpus obovatus TaxID=246614 RepID=UPI003D9F8EEC